MILVSPNEGLIIFAIKLCTKDLVAVLENQITHLPTICLYFAFIIAMHSQMGKINVLLM